MGIDPALAKVHNTLMPADVCSVIAGEFLLDDALSGSAEAVIASLNVY